MKKQIIHIFLFVFLVGFVHLSLASDIESFTVNGLQVIFKPNTATEIIAANMYFKGGSKILNEKQAGIENLAFEVATKATVNYPKDKLNAALEGMDSKITSSAARDYSSLRLLCVKQNFDKSWDIFSDVILHPVFNKEDVDLQRQQLLSAIRQQNDDPDSYLRDLFNRAFYLDHPYANEVDGTEQTVSSFSPEDLKTFFNQKLQTSQMLLVVVGNTSRNDLEKMVQNSFGQLPAGSYQETGVPEVKHAEPTMKIVKREIPTNYILGGFSAPAFATGESYPMMIASSILRDRLFEEVRTKRGLSYAPSAGYTSSRASYGFIYVTAVNPDTTIKVMTTELDRMKDKEISQQELKNKVNGFITRYYLANETNESQADFLARYELMGGGYEQNSKFLDNLKKVDPASVQNVCKNYMHNLQFVLIGNPASLEIKSFMY